MDYEGVQSAGVMSGLWTDMSFSTESVFHFDIIKYMGPVFSFWDQGAPPRDRDPSLRSLEAASADNVAGPSTDIAAAGLPASYTYTVYLQGEKRTHTPNFVFF